MTSSYPQTASDRDRWILDQRPKRNTLDPERPSAFLIEQERAESGEIESVATIFLTNRECPWRCLMCDLWKNTFTHTVPHGAIPNQIDFAVSQLDVWPEQVKLYNRGSFLYRAAIPQFDFPGIAQSVPFGEHVVFGSQPRFVG